MWQFQEGAKALVLAFASRKRSQSVCTWMNEREIFQVYGFEQIKLLSNLEKAGLLKKDTGRDIWSEVNRVFNSYSTKFR